MPQPTLSVPDPAELHSSTDSGKPINTFSPWRVYSRSCDCPAALIPPLSSYHIISAIIHLRPNRILIPVVVAANCSLAMQWIIQNLPLI